MLKTDVDASDLAAAKTDYANARPYYEHVESDVDGFVKKGHKATDNAGNLDYLIDRLSNDPLVDQLRIRRLKKRRLVLKDMIAQLESELIPDLNA